MQLRKDCSLGAQFSMYNGNLCLKVHVATVKSVLIE